MAQKHKQKEDQPASSDESSSTTSSSEQNTESDDASMPDPIDNKNEASDASDASIDNNDDSSDEEENNNNTTSTNAPPPISKSWTTLTTHSPCYTGGKVVFSKSVHDVNTTSELGGENGQSHFLLAQRGGDVAVIEASTGLLLRTLRKGTAYPGSGGDVTNGENDEDNDDNDEEEMMDAEAITAFDVSPNNQEVIVVTRGHLVRRYSLVENETGDGTINSKSKKTDKKIKYIKSVTSLTNPAPIIQSLGRSGHTLPVTQISYHPSGIFFATGSVDGLVKIWDVRNGYATHAFLPPGGGKGRHAVTCLQWKQVTTSLILAVGREDGSISIHDLMLQEGKKSNLPLVVLRDHVSAVTCVVWCDFGGGKVDSSSKRHHNGGGGLFFSSGRDSVINTWLISEEEVAADAPPKKKKKMSDGGGKGASTKVAYTRIRTLPVYEQVESLILLSRRFRPASESKGQQAVVDKRDIVLATVGTKGIVRLWKASPTGKEGAHSISDLSLVASQDETEAFGEDKGGYTSLHLISLSMTHLSPLLVAVDAEHNMTFMRMGWGEDDNGDPKLRIGTDRAIVGDNGEILDLAVIPVKKASRDRQTIAVATNSAQVRIFGLADANNDEIGEDTNAMEENSHPALSPRGLLDGHTAIVLAIDASPCGRYLTTAGKDKTMRLWHIDSKKCIGVATGHTEAVGSVALSNKLGCYDVGGKAAESGAGAFSVTASKDRTLKVWPLPGSAVLDKCAVSGEELPMRARLSARAHEKVRNTIFMP